MTTANNFKWFMFLFCFLANSPFAFAQKAQAMHWYFGDHYGIDFSGGYPQVDYNTSMYTYEACTTISDKDGELLFYTNGGGRANQAICGHIWNRNHEIMQGGDLGYDLGGGYSAAQGVVAFAKPGADNVYSMLTVDEYETTTTNPDFPKGKGCRYFEIDMNANGGLGQVTLTNQHLFTPAFEYLAATIHNNCLDYWAIALSGHHHLSGDPNAADSFYVFLVSNNGPTLTHVIPMPEGQSGLDDEYGLLRISPDGSKLICGSFLYDFDNSTGLIQPNQSMLESIGLGPEEPVAFAPNSRFLYRFALAADTINAQLKIIQYDLSENDLTAADWLIAQTNLISYASIGTPQLGPDGKLYFMIQNGFFTSPTSLSVIHYPNTAGPDALAEFEVALISNIPDSRFLRFGSYSDHIFKYDPQLGGFPHDTTTMNCQVAVPVLLEAPPEMDCYYWSDGSTGTSTTAHEPGLYWVEYLSGCNMGADSFWIIHQNDLFEVDLGEDRTLCGEESLLLQAPAVENASYLWQDSSELMALTAYGEGVYWVMVQKDQCRDSDTIHLSQKAIPDLSLGADTSLCLGEVWRLRAHHPDWSNYEWQDESSYAWIDIHEPGTYQLTIENECGSASDEIDVSYYSCDGCPVFVPNAFSPDGNYTNDVFEVHSPCPFVSYQLQIFDRWGSQVFGTTDPAAGWDGRLKGQVCQIGMYVYRLDYAWIDRQGKLREEISFGDLVLLR